MKIVVVGGTGTIGTAVVKELQARHEVITAAHSSGDITVDITSPDSITNMYKKLGNIDAVIATTGKVKFEKFDKMDAEKYLFGLQNKLLGQINLVLIGRNYISKEGSFTLTSGILSDDPIQCGTSAAMVNGALNSFVKAAAIDMPDKTRINIVSPTILSEAKEIYEKFFLGFQPVPAAQVALAYSKSVEGLQTGQIYQIGF